MKTIRVFTSYEVSTYEFERYFSLAARNHDVRFIINKSGPADLAVVLNYVRGFHYVWGRHLSTLKLLQEPETNGLIYRFTRSHSPVFDQVWCHNADPNDPRQKEVPPLLADHLGAEPRLTAPKTRTVSVIASVLSNLPGHKNRNEFIGRIESEKLDVDVFGRGRHEIATKNEGLEPYMYSIAIENSIQKSYWTEKFIDCIMCDTIPLYHGAPNLGEYFDSRTFIELPINDFEAAKKILSSLTSDDYLHRMPFLLEVKNQLLTEFNLGLRLVDHLEGRKLEHSSATFRRLWTLDSITHIVVVIASSILKLASRVSRTVRNVRSTNEI